MFRVLEDELRQILNIPDCSKSLAIFLKAAHNLVNYIDKQCNSEGLLDKEALKDIELFLAAHFYTNYDKQYQEKRTEHAAAVFQGTTGMLLESSDYGQSAMLLDVTGCLAKL